MAIIMTLSTINSSSQTYVGKTFVNSLNPTQKLDDSGEVETNFEPPSPPNINNSLAQNVLQTLKNLGVESIDLAQEGGVLPEETNQALQSFVQNLYKALTPSTNSAPPFPLLPSFTEASSSENSIFESLEPTLTKISGGSNLRYNIDLSEADLGDYLPQVRANIQTALDNIGKYISSKVVFDVKVFTRNAEENTLAEASTTMITANNRGEETVDTSFVSDSIYGVELSPDTPDSRLYINIDRLEEMSFDGKPTPDKFDLTSILTHEILHGLAFTGLLGSESELRTGFDELISVVDDVPMFNGRHAKTVNNGRPIPLTPETSGVGSAFYHVAIPGDLMSESIKKGEVKTISALNVAMLQDMGVAVTGASPNSPPPKVQMAYNTAPPTPSEAVKNLMNSIQQQSELQTNFDNLVNTLSGFEVSPDLNLQNFLTQLAANTQELPPFQNSGSLFSVTA